MNRKLVFGWSVSVLQSVSSLGLLATSAWLLSRADQRPSVMYLSIAVVGVRAFALGKAFFRYSERLILHDAVFRSATKTRVQIYKGMVPIAPLGLKDESLGSLLTNLVDDTDESLNINLKFRPALFQSISVTLLGVFIYLWLAPKAAWLAVLVLLIGFAFSYVLSRNTSERHLQEISKLRSELAQVVETYVARAKIISAYQWQDKRDSKVEEISRKLYFLERKIGNVTGALQGTIVFALYSSIAAALAVTAIAGDLLPGEQVAVLVLIPLGIFEYLQNLPSAFQARLKARLSIERLASLNEAKIPNEIEFNGTKNLNAFSDLRISNCVVRYPDGNLVRLPDLSVGRGDTLSIVGKSGSGKSTVANVLVGFLKPLSGQFLINGTAIDEFNSDSLLELFGLLEQNPNVLAGTIRDNLLLASPNSTNEELEKVLKELDIWEMLQARGGLLTDVGARGGKLSGGEVQRLAFARILLANREVVVLDEPTSSLPHDQGKKLIKAFLELAKAKNLTVILITHDKKLAKLTDRLVEI